MARDWSKHKYIQKFKSGKTGKWVYVYEDESKRRPVRLSNGEMGADLTFIHSHSRKGMTEKERELDDRKHRSYNKKRAVVNTKNAIANLGRAVKAAATGKSATKYLSNARRSGLKTMRNITNLATSYAGHTGERTKAKAWIENQLYGNSKRKDWNPNWK